MYIQARSKVARNLSRDVADREDWSLARHEHMIELRRGHCDLVVLVVALESPGCRAMPRLRRMEAILT